MGTRPLPGHRRGQAIETTSSVRVPLGVGISTTSPAGAHERLGDRRLDGQPPCRGVGVDRRDERVLRLLPAGAVGEHDLAAERDRVGAGLRLDDLRAGDRWSRSRRILVSRIAWASLASWYSAFSLRSPSSRAALMRSAISPRADGLELLDLRLDALVVRPGHRAGRRRARSGLLVLAAGELLEQLERGDLRRRGGDLAAAEVLHLGPERGVHGDLLAAGVLEHDRRAAVAVSRRSREPAALRAAVSTVIASSRQWPSASSCSSGDICSR